LRNHVGCAPDPIPVDIGTDTATVARITCVLTENVGRKIRKLGVGIPGTLRLGQTRNHGGTKHATEDSGCHEACSNARATLHTIIQYRRPECRVTMPGRFTTVNLGCREGARSETIAYAVR
jgi:hypothetical protein